MTKMQGSKPVYSFTIPYNDATKEHLDFDGRMKDTMRINGFKWFRDYTTENTDTGILVEIYNEDCMPILKEFIVEYKV